MPGLALLPDLPLLTPDTFTLNTVCLARHLVGHYLLRCWPGTPSYVLCRIVETEAYTQDDPACHAYQKNRGRAANLYQAPGLAYVYLIYGMYYCLNVVTEATGTAGAILFRALEVIAHSPDWSPSRLNGPGKLCRGLAITTTDHNGVNMLCTQSPLQLIRGASVDNLAAVPRIGITRAVDWPWRFYDPMSSEVSKR